MPIEITADNTEEILQALKHQIEKGLTEVGILAEGYAQDKAPVDTGALRDSITNKVSQAEQSVVIGTNLEYAKYVEMGTGKYVAGGRPTPWAYQDSKGNWHRTSGQPKREFMKPAATEHTSEYRQVIEDNLRG